MPTPQDNLNVVLDDLLAKANGKQQLEIHLWRRFLTPLMKKHCPSYVNTACNALLEIEQQIINSAEPIQPK
jgi:hypothetical protein